MPEGTNISWNESNDPSIVDWKRIRLALEHENLLINHRFTWWLTCQGALVAIFTLIFPQIHPSQIRPDSEIIFLKVILLAVVIVGIITSLFFASALQAAHEAHRELETWWNLHYADEPGTAIHLKRHPPICGTKQLKVFRIPFHYHHFPNLFIFVWALIFPAVFYNYFLIYGTYFLIFMACVVLILVGLAIYFMGRKSGRREARKQPTP